MESPPIPIPRTSNTQRRMSSTSQLFTRITPNPTSRHLNTSKLSNQHLHIKYNKRNQSFQSQKQNINYQKYLFKIKSSLKIDEKQMASNYLLNLRKQYDQMAKNIQIKTKDINLMKKQIDFIRNKSKNYKDNWGCIKDRLKIMGKQIEICKIRQDSAVMQTKILQHIITRMKADQLQHKTILFNKQLQLKQKKKQLKFKIEQTIHCDGYIHKIYEQIIKIKQQFKKSKQQRQFKLRQYKDCMHDVQEQQKFQQERKQRSFQLLNIQSNDVMDMKNNVLRDLLLTNQLLDKLLQSKISDLLNHYQELQKSYHLIKAQTNIIDPYLIAKRFFSYTQNLQQITSTIRDLQIKQQQLLKYNKVLKQRQKQIKIKQLEQQKIATSKKNQIKPEKQNLAEEYLQKQLMIRKINSWAIKICQNIGYCQLRKSGDTNTADLIQQICNYALKKLEQINNQQISAQKFQSPGVRLKKLIKQFSIQDEKIRRSQAQQINQNNILQNAYICNQRRQVKKNQKNQFLIKIQLQKKPSTININSAQLQKIKQ